MSSPFRNKERVFPALKLRFNLVRCGVILLFSTLTVRLFIVQAIMHPKLQDKADRQFKSQHAALPLRHLIFDRNLRVLAESLPVTSCYVDPTLIKDKNQLESALASDLGVSKSVLESKIANCRGSFVWVKRDVPAYIGDSIRKQKLEGVGFKTEVRRHYPFGKIASHLLGLVGVEGSGLSGIEMVMEKVLNSSGDQFDFGFKNLPAGNVELTIDGAIQQIVEKELAWGVEKTRAKKGMAVVQDPWSGEILAMATLPAISLDPDDPPDPTELRIPPVVDVFEPGSTFKIVTAAASIEEKIYSPAEIFDGENGAFKCADITIHDHEPRKKLSFDEIWIYSSNIGAAKLGERLGAQKLYQYARAFGFGVYPGSGIPAEGKGMLRPPNQWSGVSRAVVSFGQEVSVTAIQLVGAYSAIANGGQLMEPKIIKAIVDGKKNVLWSDSPQAVRTVISKPTAEELTRILVRAVEIGTGREAQVKWREDFKVAGKTGTAQKFDAKKGGYGNDLSLISFCGFFPANKPKYTIAIFLDEPEGRRWGGVDAAPIFRRIVERLMPKGNV